jgi:hypothetical protein
VVSLFSKIWQKNCKAEKAVPLFGPGIGIPGCNLNVFKKDTPMRNILLTMCWFACVSSNAAHAGENDEKYYLILFASQQGGNQARFSHSFATFVKVTGSEESETPLQVEHHTISWLPKTLKIVLLRRTPETGVNLSLKASLDWARKVNGGITAWGPFQIKKELFDKAMRQIQRLESGQVLYKAMDRAYRPGVATNCIHAISDINDQQGLLFTGASRGESASQAVLIHFRPWILGPGTTHRWLLAHLPLMNNPINYRSFH